MQSHKSNHLELNVLEVRFQIHCVPLWRFRSALSIAVSHADIAKFPLVLVSWPLTTSAKRLDNCYPLFALLGPSIGPVAV